MASPVSIPPTSGSGSSSPRQRQRYRYRLPNKRKKPQGGKQRANMRALIALGILLVALVVTLLVIGFHLVVPYTDSY